MTDCTRLSGRALTQPGSWLCQTRLWPRTRMPLACAYCTSWSPGPKLYEPSDGSVVSHFISLPGVSMSNCASAMAVSPPTPRSASVRAVPKYRPPASAAAFSVLPDAAAGLAAASVPSTTASAEVTVTVHARCDPLRILPMSMDDLL